jgi:peptide/nickel transport system permease protein
VLRFLLRRCAVGLLTLAAVSVLLFAATNILPGDVAQTVLGKEATPERVAALRGELHLDESVVSRYFHWVEGLVQGNLGDSAVQVAQNAPDPSVGAMIATPLVNSLILALIASLLIIPLALVLGTIAAVRAGKTTDYAVSYGSLFLGSLPEFVIGTFLILLFFNELHLYPPVALVPPGASPLDNPEALVLPLLTLLAASLPFGARQVRAGVVESLKEDYVTVARLGGIPERRVLRRYALRNALPASIQAFAQTIQYLFGGIIVVEAVFAYPGLGNLLTNAVLTRDVTLVLAIALVIAAVFIVINIVADLLVVFLVPKLRTGLR